jgi:hypothetical protein
MSMAVNETRIPRDVVVVGASTATSSWPRATATWSWTAPAPSP